MKSYSDAFGACCLIGAIAAAAQVGILTAQTNAPGSSERITVIGCVQRSQSIPADTVGATVVPEGETRYLLSNITLVPERSSAGTAGGGSAANLLTQAVKMYRLDDSADALIAPHVGDRVQVTGTLVSASPSPTGTAGQTPRPGNEAARPPILRVASLQKISSDSAACSR